MLRQLRSPSLLIAILLGTFSTYLAYQGKYEAALTGAGAAVAAATARKSGDDTDENKQRFKLEKSTNEIVLKYQSMFHEEQAKFYIKQCDELKNEMSARETVARETKDQLMQLLARAEDVRKYEKEMRQEIEKLRSDINIFHQPQEQQVKIEEIELEIQRLESKKRQILGILGTQETKSLPAASLDAVEGDIQEKIQQKSGEKEDYL
jgi:archaellum component FlaC